jgi:predicted SAM-dependent methyltransferase
MTVSVAPISERVMNRLRAAYNTLFGNLWGTRFCPVCSMRVCAFLPLPGFYKKNHKKHRYPYSLDDAETLNHKAFACPRCYASDRDRLFALFVKTRLTKGETVKLLEIAPSTPLSRMLKEYSGISLRTADLVRQDVDDCVDIMDMRCYQDGAFDAFICSHVLEHVPDDVKALHELFRIVGPGGWGILMVPVITAATKIDEDAQMADIGERWRRFGQFDHLRTYSKSGFVERMERAGFIVRQYGTEYFGKDVFERHGVSDKSILYVVEKPAASTAQSQPVQTSLHTAG